MENKSNIFLGIIGTALLFCFIMNKEHTPEPKTSRKSYERYAHKNDVRPSRYDYSVDHSSEYKPKVAFDFGYNWISHHGNGYGFNLSYGNPKPVYCPIYTVVSYPRPVYRSRVVSTEHKVWHSSTQPYGVTKTYNETYSY